MATKKRKTTTKKEEPQNVEQTELFFQDSVPYLDTEVTPVPIDESFVVSLNLTISNQADEISRLVAANGQLSAKITSLTLRVGGLLKEKEQLTLQINELSKRKSNEE